MLFVLSCISLMLVAESGASTPKACKVTPDSPNWPSVSDWTNLNQTLGGALLRPDPPAAACHKEHSAYDSQVCRQIRARWTSSQWHSDNPTSSLWQNWNNYSCLPNATVCTTDGYPLYVVNASTPDHVQVAVEFAKARSIRLNIKSTGHDFLGRSVQPKSLSIWTHHMRTLEWHNDTYALRSCSKNISGTFVTAGSGIQMREVYHAATDRGLMVVGGDSSTVSLGGYITGGGHSALSPLLGMGADQVVEIEMVTADGSQIVANECQNTDLFWAMRGGGGSTFGVATAFTIRAHPTVPITVWNGNIFGNTSVDANWDAVAHIHKQWAVQLAPLSVSGYLWGPVLSYRRGTSLQVIMPNTSSINSLKDRLQPILDEVRNITEGKTAARGNYTYYKTYGDWLFPPLKPGRARRTDDTMWFPGNGISKLITSWLWDEKAMQSLNLKQALRGSIDNDTLLWSDFTGGPGTWKPPFLRGGGNAVNPAWRSAIVRPAAEMQWAGDDKAKLAERRKTLKSFGASMKALAPNGGTYGNEADAQTVDYGREFWGGNYPRLLEIKKNVDPHSVFWCRACVGSDLWEEGAHGELCRKP